MAAVGLAERPRAVLVHALWPAGVVRGRVVRELYFAIRSGRTCGQRFRRKGGRRGTARQRRRGGNAAICAGPQNLSQQYPPADVPRHPVFIVGLGGFMLSGENTVYWGIAAAIFTLGEIIYAPGEYMLIDNIAPPGMKASYFSAQALGWLGAAANPMITGIILTNLPHWSLFVIMMAAIIVAWLMILRGMSVKAWCESPKAA